MNHVSSLLFCSLKKTFSFTFLVPHEKSCYSHLILNFSSINKEIKLVQSKIQSQRKFDSKTVKKYFFFLYYFFFYFCVFVVIGKNGERERQRTKGRETKNVSCYTQRTQLMLIHNTHITKFITFWNIFHFHLIERNRKKSKRTNKNHNNISALIAFACKSFRFL